MKEKGHILARQSSLPSEFDRSHGLPATGKNERREVAPFQNPLNKKPHQQSLFSSTTFWAGAVAQKMIGANPYRRYLLIQNIGTVSIFVGFGIQPDLAGNNALVLPPNTGITFENGICPNNECFVIASTGCQVTVVEAV